MNYFNYSYIRDVFFERNMALEYFSKKNADG